MAEVTVSHVESSHYDAVRSLIDAVREITKREESIKAANTVWFQAYHEFRNKESKIGLPEDTVNRLAYSAIVESLRASGKMQIIAMKTHLGDCDDFPATITKIEGCLLELAIDENWADNPGSVNNAVEFLLG